MNTIIAATDFSVTANNAVRYAAALAHSSGARLVLYHAVEDPVPATDVALIGTDDYWNEDKSLQNLEELKATLQEATNNELDITIKLRFGNLREELKQLRYEEKPFMTVMAASKKDWFDRLVTGCNTLCVSHKCHEPLLLVPENAIFSGFKNIALATDLDSVADSIPLHKITRCLEQFQAQLHILNIAKPAGLDGAQSAEAIALQNLFKDFNPQFHFINNEHVAEGIRKYLDIAKPDLLILIPKQHHLFYQSNSKPFILHPSVPVMVLSKHP